MANRKIDIYVQVAKSDAYKYVGTTTQSQTCKEAKTKFLANNPQLTEKQVHASFK